MLSRLYVCLMLPDDVQHLLQIRNLFVSMQSPLFFILIVHVCLSQIFTMRQTADMLVRADPEKPTLEGFYKRLAVHQGWASPQHIVANVDESTVRDDWKRVLRYTEANNPYTSVCVGYVPFTSAVQPLHEY